MSKRKVKELIKEIDFSMSADVKAACVERLLREQLNIHLGEELFNLSVKWCAGDILKAGTMVKYANAVGVNGVLQLLRG